MKTQLVSQLNNYGANDLTTSETSTAWNYMFMLVRLSRDRHHPKLYIADKVKVVG